RVWRDWGFVVDPVSLTVSGLSANQLGVIRFGGASTSTGRHRLLTIDGQAYQHNSPGGSAPIVPETPTDAPFTADANGEVTFTLTAASTSAAFSFLQV